MSIDDGPNTGKLEHMFEHMNSDTALLDALAESSMSENQAAYRTQSHGRRALLAAMGIARCLGRRNRSDRLRKQRLRRDRRATRLLQDHGRELRRPRHRPVRAPTVAFIARGSRYQSGFVPERAFTYCPDAETAAFVRARDRHCRFPGCRVPAAQCQIDHVEPFDHTNPTAGGRTIAANLQCLCFFHHQLKTAKLWTAQAFSGGQIRWIDSYGDQFVTHPGGHKSGAPPTPDLVHTSMRAPTPGNPKTSTTRRPSEAGR